MANLMQQVLSAFKSAGLSENQAKIITAEVGRESSFLPENLFGSHTDDKNSKTNVGMLSWQNGREVPLLRSLAKMGLIENGEIKQNQESLNLMARYAVNEMRTKPEYKQTKQAFLDNPDVDYNTGAKVLGKNFIKWRYDDPQYASGHKNRDQFYAQVGGSISNNQNYDDIRASIGKPNEAKIVRRSREESKQRVNQLISAYDKQVKANSDAKKQAPSNERVASLLAAYDARTPNTDQTQGLPDFDQNGVITYDQAPQTETPDRTLTDSLKGLGEAGLTTLTSATTGALGMIGGTATQAAREIAGGNFGTPEAANRIANNAASTASDYTYAPRTQAGQDYVQTIADVTEPLAALTPATAELGLAARAARGAAPQATIAAQRTAQAVAPVVERTGQVIQRPVQATANAIKSGVDSLKDAVGLSRAPDEAAPANMGAAQVDQATVRQSLAQDLPYKPELTQGQLSRDPAQLKFEVETSKDAELGAPIRQRYEDQHQVMQQNIDAFIDSTGAKSTNMRETGISVDKALQKQMQIDKTKVRVAYAKADKSEEAQTPVDLNQPIQVGDRDPTTVIDYLNSQPDLPTTPILTSAKKTAESIGIAKRDENGNLVAGNPTIKQMEEWRSQINHNVNAEAPNIRQAAILKDMIDRHVEPYQGTLYKAARMERKRVAEHWENRKIITDLTTNKTGSDDRKVALEDIQKRIIHDGSLDDMRFAKRALLTAGEEGKQAWKDIQGQTLQEIKDAATANVAPDAKGNQMISPAALNKAINKLDKDGKLDYIFGQKGAEQLRAVNEISKTLFTVPASAAINHSNTAATLTAALDIALSGFSGFPAPVASALRLASKHIKDNKVRARVNQALNINKTN